MATINGQQVRFAWCIEEERCGQVQNTFKFRQSTRIAAPNNSRHAVHTLLFGWNFDKEIKPSVLPDNLHTLKFGHYFDKEIKAKTFPANLHSLEFGRNFNQVIKANVLPASPHTKVWLEIQPRNKTKSTTRKPPHTRIGGYTTKRLNSMCYPHRCAF